MSEAINPEVRWIPVRAAARVMKITKQRVHKLIQEGALASERIDGTVLVSTRSITDLIALRAQKRKGKNADRKRI